jgi:hypothetical protein
MFCLQQYSALANAELLARRCRRCKTSGEFGGCERFGGDIVDAVVALVGFKGVLLGGLGCIEGGPGLASGRDVLARVLCCLLLHCLQHIGV